MQLKENHLEFDYNKCIKCGACRRACGQYVIEMENDSPIEKYPELCIACGHCVGICPKDAIIHKNMDMKNFTQIQKSSITLEQLNNLARSRRSIRYFQQKPLSDEIIKSLLDSVRYIPSAENAQSLKYLVINNPERIMAIKRAMESMFEKVYKITKFPIIKIFLTKRMLAFFKTVVERWNLGGENGKEDPHLRSAPTLIIICAKKKNTLTIWDASIASYHIILAAETMGLGTCWNGMHAILSNMIGSIKKSSLIPKKHKVIASICVGYPTIKYLKTVDRKVSNYEIIS